MDTIWLQLASDAPRNPPAIEQGNNYLILIDEGCIEIKSIEMFHEYFMFYALIHQVWRMLDGIVGDTVEKNKDPVIGVEQEFAVERIGGTKATVVMGQLVTLGDTLAFYQVIYSTKELDNLVPGNWSSDHTLFLILNLQFLLQQPRLQQQSNPLRNLQMNQIHPLKVCLGDIEVVSLGGIISDLFYQLLEFSINTFW